MTAKRSCSRHRAILSRVDKRVRRIGVEGVPSRPLKSALSTRRLVGNTLSGFRTVRAKSTTRESVALGIRRFDPSLAPQVDGAASPFRSGGTRHHSPAELHYQRLASGLNRTSSAALQQHVLRCWRELRSERPKMFRVQPTGGQSAARDGTPSAGRRNSPVYDPGA